MHQVIAPHDLADIPEATVASFAGTHCPLRLGALSPGQYVVDVGGSSANDAGDWAIPRLKCSTFLSAAGCDDGRS